jgi:hypothetical protein
MGGGWGVYFRFAVVADAPSRLLREAGAGSEGVCGLTGGVRFLGRHVPASQVTRRGICERAKRRISCAGHEVGRRTRIIVFISTTQAAILTKRRRRVSNCATRHIDRLGIDSRRPHISQ